MFRTTPASTRAVFRRPAFWFLLAAFMHIPAGLLAQATIEGTVTLPAGAPKAALNRRYQIKAGDMAAQPAPVAVVYLEGDFPPARATDAGPKAEMWQKDFQFIPSVLPVQRGATVEFPNGDDGYHNVFSYSKPKRFDLGRYRKDEKPAAIVFDQPGVVKLYCEIHEHMRATILVLDTPYFTTTDAEGKFRLENLPAGQFTLKAWLDEKNVMAVPATLKDGETRRVNFPTP